MQEHHCPSCGAQLKIFEIVSYGNVTITDSGLINFNSKIIVLPPSQFLLAEALIRARGRSLTRSALANLVGTSINDSTVTKYIERVRDSFRQANLSFNQIECMKGFGAYRWIREPAIV